MSDKYVVYCIASDQLMMDGKEYYVGSEKDVKALLKNEVVDAKRYEMKPASFVKEWERKIKKAEASKNGDSYKFSPGFPEFHYRRQTGEERYILVLGQEKIRKSGQRIKDFASIKEATALSLKTIKNVAKEMPDCAYFILDLEKYDYVSRIDKTGISKY